MNTAKRILLALMLLAIGWTGGYAQRSEPEFVIAIEAPAGGTTVECVSGCEFIGARDLENPKAGRLKTYEFGCSGPAGQRCTARVGGWRVR